MPSIPFTPGNAKPLLGHSEDEIGISALSLDRETEGFVLGTLGDG